jgi:hypothetical protein
MDGKRQLVAGIIVAGIIFISLGSLWVGDMLSREHVLIHYIEGTVIWGHADSALTMPGKIPDCVQANGNSLSEMVCFSLAKPLYLIKLMGMKLFYFFLLARPYYSVPHNILILLIVLPVYALTVLAWYHDRKNFYTWAFPAIIIMLQALVVTFTFADWDSRHLQVILPLFFIFASTGAMWLRDRQLAEKNPEPLDAE